VFDRLNSIYVTDDRFRNDFSLYSVDTGGQRRKLAKYILCRLEEDAAGRSCDPETDPGTIEHVLPETPSEDWAAHIPSEIWEAFVYRLGNLTLLESAKNREVGNASYGEKLGAYSGSGYALSRQIPVIAREQWTVDLLEQRQKRLADRAVHIWRASFS
jgi:hypothetical protein